jgi:hypothetical protein
VIPCPGPLLWTRASDDTDPIVVGLVECCACLMFAVVVGTDSHLIDERHYDTTVIPA